MRKALFFILLFSSVCCAQNLQDLSEEFRLELDFSTGVVPEDLEINMYVVYGRPDFVDQILLDSLTSNASTVSSQATINSDGMERKEEVRINRVVLRDDETSLRELKAGSSIVLLVGLDNRVVDEAYSEYDVNESSKYMGQILLGRCELDRDSRLIILAHNASAGEKLERDAVEYSPLRGVVEDAYIPVVATGIGIFLMQLMTIAKTVAEFLALDIGRKKKAFGHTGPQIKGIYLNEVASILGAACVLGFALTWTYTGPSPRFFDLIFLNSGICLFAALSHELSHRLVGRLFGVQVEYRFWFAGSAITIITAFFGNSFGIQGFLMDKIDGEISKWKYAITKLAAPVVSMSITLVFAFLFLEDPQPIYQMIYATASIWAMAEIIPVRGLDGYDIKSWSRLIWLIFFLLISAVYFTVNFI